MEKVIVKIIAHLLGKNSAHLARKLQTFIGGLLLGSALFPLQLDPALIEAGEIVPTAGEIQDGLTVGETLRAVLGIVLIWASRVMSYLRARNLDTIASWFGLLVGRGIQSLFRSMLTVTAAFLAWIGYTGGTGDGITGVPLYDVIGALIALGISGISSRLQDEKQNPVSGSPDANRIK